ncbi:hypothetical protein RKD55_000295 [Rossellomorea marisflavi]
MAVHPASDCRRDFLNSLLIVKIGIPDLLAAPIGVLLNVLTMINLPYHAFEIIKGRVLMLGLAVTYIHARNLRSI